MHIKFITIPLLTLWIVNCQCDQLRSQLTKTQEALEEQQKIVITQTETIGKLEKSEHEKAEFIKNYTELVTSIFVILQSISSQESLIRHHQEGKDVDHSSDEMLNMFGVINNKIESLNDKIYELNELNNNLTVELEGLRNEHTEDKAIISEKECIIANLQSAITLFKNEIATQKETIDKLHAEIFEKDREINRIFKQYNQIAKIAEKRDICYFLIATGKQIKQLQRAGYFKGRHFGLGRERPTGQTLQNPKDAGFNECECSSQKIYTNTSLASLSKRDIWSVHKDYFDYIHGADDGLIISDPEIFWSNSRLLVIKKN